MKSIKRQAILLALTLVFALTLCAAVAAEDTGGTAADSTAGSIGASATADSSGFDSESVDTSTASEAADVSSSEPGTTTDSSCLDSSEGSSTVEQTTKDEPTSVPDEISQDIESESETETSEDETIEETDTEATIQADECVNGLVDPRVLIIHSSSSTKMTNDAAHNIMNLINPTQPGYDPDDSSTWLVRFDIRTTSQIAEMSPDDLKSLIENADIIICEWIFEPGLSNFKNVINANPNILKNKPGKIFLALESYPELTKLSQINGNFLFEGVSDSVIGNTDTKNTILYDLKNANFPRLNTYKTTYPQISDWINAGVYYAAKGTKNYENQYKWALKEFTELNGGTWPSEWDPEPYYVLPKEMLYRDGTIFTSLEEYLTQYPLDPLKPTVGIVEYDSPVLAGNMDHFETTINKLTDKGFNVIPVAGAYSGTIGTQPLNIYSAMVKFFSYDPDDPNHVVTTTEYEANSSKYSYRIDALVSFYYFSLGSGFLDQTNKFLDNMNVPVFRAMSTTKRTEGEWLTSDDGLVWSDTYYQIAIPETQGIIEPIFVATTEKELDPVTGAELIHYKAIPDRIDKLTERVKNWVKLNLKYTNNEDKKIALIYYNYPPGKQNIGASYLAVPDSIIEILNMLKQEGYTVNNIPQTADELVSMMLERGINVANWAPGILEEMANNPNTILWDAEEYKAWFDSLNSIAKKEIIEGPAGYIEELTKLGVEYGLQKNDETAKTATIKSIEKWTQEMTSLANTYPEKSQQAVEQINNMSNALKQIMNGEDAWNSFYEAKNAFMALEIPGLTGWGEAPGNIMTVTRDGKEYIVIPGMYFGNVFIGPEPQRGWEADADKFYHSTVVPPPHCYLAWYAWVNSVFDADAQVHIGRHATYEWLPRKQVALAEFDYSDITIADTPSVYIYIIDGIGEGLQAKRRGLAVIVDHLTPPLTTTTLYGGFLELKEDIEQYQIHNGDAKKPYAEAIRSKVNELNLGTDLGINPDDLTDEELVETVEDYLRDIQQTLMPYGLHTFGKSWTNEEIALLATVMVSADGGINNPSLQRLLAQENGWNFDNLTLDQAEQLNNQAQDWVLQLLTGQKTAADLTSNPELQGKLNEAKGYAGSIIESFSSELNSLIDALNGGYVTPSTGNDPIRNPGAIPTGKNFYGISENLLPTKVAWNLGKKLADMALSQLDSIPEKIAAVVWCVETARDDGTMVSFVLRMLGVEPTWTSTGSISNMKATPLATLLSDLNAMRASNGLLPLTERPRIDVIVTTSGLFRDLFPRVLINMDRSFRVALAASYNTIVAQYSDLKDILDYTLQTLVNAKYTGFKGNDPIEHNYIAKHWIELTQKYVDLGIPANDAGELAITRIFAPPVGDYGAGVNKAIEQSWTWEKRDQVADVYLNRMSHSYSERNWGTTNRALFEDLLSGITTAYHSRSTNLYGVLDNDDYFDYYGGLSMAIEKVNNGVAPNLNVLYYANPANPEVMSLQTFMAREMRTRYFNPEWIKGMMQEGYSGARYMSNKFVSYLWGWQVTNPNIVQDWMWKEVVDVYFNDKYNLGVNEWLSQGNNAYAMISMMGTTLTAAYKINDATGKPYWQADKTTIREITNSWKNLIAIRGVACCDCSCGNIAMMEWATQFMNPNMLAQFYKQLYQATKNPMFAPPNPPTPTEPKIPATAEEPATPTTPEPGVSPAPTTPGQPTAPTSPGTEASSASIPPGMEVSAAEVQVTSAGPAKAGQGKKAYEVTKVTPPSSSAGGIPIWALLGVVLLTGLAILGYFKGSILGFILRR